MSVKRLVSEKDSAVVLGCMRISQMDPVEVSSLVHTSLEHGITSFDHADIYGAGRSEVLFGKVLASEPSLRDAMYIQSKCGIKKERYDFSKEYIVQSTEGILSRLNTEYLDCLLLHRPDVLMDAEEVADAFTELKNSGKVRHFGVSNMNTMQMELLQKYMNEKIVTNQLQLSVAHTLIIDEGINVNMADSLGQMHAGSVLDYCRLRDISIQSWSSLQYGFFEGTFIGNEKYKELNKVLDRLAEKYEVTPGTIAIAWILRIPGVGQAVIGTTKENRVAELSKAMNMKLTGEEWYELYLSAGKRLP